MNKRENFRTAFANFEAEQVAKFDAADVKRLMADVGIVRHAGKIALSKTLKKLGWSFVGPTTMHAFIQAMGLVNDHLDGCDSRQAALAARAQFIAPALVHNG